MRYLLLGGMVGLTLIFVFHGHVDAIGRGGAKGGGAKGGGAQGGGKQAPKAAAHPTPSMSPGHANRAPQIQRPAPAKPQAPRPAVNGQKPAAKPAAAKQDFKMPSNFNRPAQLPKTERPPVQIAKYGDKRDFGNTTKPGISQPKAGGKDRPSLADLQKKQPGGVFDRPKDAGNRFPGAGKLPDRRPEKDDMAAWLGGGPGQGGSGTPFQPNIRPGQGGSGTKFEPKLDPKKFDPGKFDPKKFDPKKLDPKNRPDWFPAKRPNDKIHNEFTKNWKNAIGNDVNIGKNIGNTNIGDINVDMSKNYNFQQINQQRNVVNNNFRQYQGNWFNNSWWNNQGYAGGYSDWHYHNYQPPSYWWRGASWGGLVGWMTGAAWSPPVYSDYGSNVVIDQEVVYVNDQPVASAGVYAQQAIELATVEPPPASARVEWMPLGTWALMSDKDDANPSTILQLAVSKQGLVSGTWYNRTTDKSAECEGQVDPDTQRVVIRRPEQPSVVLEVGVYNLTQDATPCLIHFGTVRTQTWYLARLEDPGGKSG